MANHSSYSPKSANRNLSRYIRHKRGMALADIAEEDKVKEVTVRASIHAVEAQRFLHAPEFASEGIVEILVDTKDKVKQALENGLTASVEVVDAMTHKTTEIPDVKLQLQAVEQYKNLAAVVQKKDGRPQTQVNVGLNVGGRDASGPVGGYIGVEDRIRALNENRERQRQLTAGETAAVVAPPEEGEEEEYSVDSK